MNTTKLAIWLQVITNLCIVIVLILVLLQMNQNEELQRVNILNQYASAYAENEANVVDEQLPTVDLSGNWEVHSSVGGMTAITVNCVIRQTDNSLAGSCTPVMDNPEASELTGTAIGETATWGYDVFFNGNPGTVSFQADSITANGMLGTINLSGTEAPFSAIRR